LRGDSDQTKCGDGRNGELKHATTLTSDRQTLLSVYGSRLRLTGLRGPIRCG
jgi:hypothetical protein